MDIKFKTRKLHNLCEEHKRAVRQWGERLAKEITGRLFDIQAAETLEDLCRVPGARCHPLRDNRAGQYAIKLTHNMRLVFEPLIDMEDIQIDDREFRSSVRRVRILEVKDYHGE